MGRMGCVVMGLAGALRVANRAWAPGSKVIVGDGAFVQSGVDVTDAGGDIVGI